MIICSKPQTQNKFDRFRNLGVQNQESLPRTAFQMPFGMHCIVTTNESFVPVTWGKKPQDCKRPDSNQIKTAYLMGIGPCLLDKGYVVLVYTL